jgi:N-acetylglucosamine kinase-like BadF-type ATPase
VRVALAIDGGNSKTDVALVREDGAVLGLARGTGSSPHHLGPAAALDVIGSLVAELPPADAPALTLLLVAGVDFPEEEAELERLASARAWARRTIVGNDTFAILRAGTERNWGIAVVCGAGINCVGVAPDGRHVRFPALGPITGDWGGGYDLGQEALFAAARSEDGRGPRTRLERAVPEHFGLDMPSELAYAIHRGTVPQRRLTDLAPLVMSLAADDAVAAAIVARLVGEVAAFVRVAATQLGLERESFDVVLGGGLLQQAEPALVEAIAASVHETAPHAVVRPTDVPAILGSALLALDELGAGAAAKERLRRELVVPGVPLAIGDGDG